MGLWAYYFFAKLYLFWQGYIDLDVPLNLGFAVLVALPVGAHRIARWAKQAVAIPLGAALLYHDSWFPPISRVRSQAGYLQDFSVDYLFELLGRFINPVVVLVLIGLLLVFLTLQRKLRMGSFAVLALLAVPLVSAVGQFVERLAAPPVIVAAQGVTGAAAGVVAAVDTGPATDASLDAQLDRFLAEADTRRTRFPGDLAGDTPFDIIVIHTCSLAWDDMEYVGQRNHAFLDDFDILMTQFSVAASYSGPAAIRLLRASCGQQTHSGIYKPPGAGCLLFANLKAAGFAPQILMNHDGQFGDFIGDLNRNGLDVDATDNRNAAIQQRAFDDSPIYDDHSLLSGWLASAPPLAEQRTALYYNTTSLHDGNRVVGVELRSAKKSFDHRLTEYFRDLQRFFGELEDAGRQAVIVFVPEHGAAVRGDRMQISGMREIPSPAVIHVPVGIKFIGMQSDPAQLVVDKPTSYQAISDLLAAVVANNPFDAAEPDLAALANGLTPTPMVADNDGTVVLKRGEEFWMRSPDGSWTEYVTRN